MGRSNRLAVVAVLAAISLLAGCFHARPEDIEAWVKPYEVNVTADVYRVQPPDEIEIRCSQVPEVHMQRQRIRPDGKISFEVLGEIDVAGKTPAEISMTIGERISELYALPGDHPVDVRIAIYASQVYYVVGQVFRPGVRPYTGRDGLLTTLVAAGPNPMAWESRVQVIRPSPLEGERPRIFQANYRDMVQRGDTTKDVLMEEGDIIYVPPTILASIGMVLEQLITPVARAFYGWYLVSNPPFDYEGGYRPPAVGR